MKFDIYQLDNIDEDSDGEEELAEYKDALLDRFSKSAEGQIFKKTHPKFTVGSWPGELIKFGFIELGTTIPRMSIEDVEEIVTNAFPRRITIFTEEQASDAISELVTFWQFLKRKYQLLYADEILAFLHQIRPVFFEIMTSSGDFGMAKTMALMGHAAGFDMTDEQDIGRFITAYNSRLSEGLDDGGPLPEKGDFSENHPGSRDRRADKARRKKNKASQSRNRK